MLLTRRKCEEERRNNIKVRRRGSRKRRRRTKRRTRREREKRISKREMMSTTQNRMMILMMMAVTTYGFLMTILRTASGPRLMSSPRDSRMWSSAVVTSSADGSTEACPSSSCQNRYRKHLSLNGCSL